MKIVIIGASHAEIAAAKRARMLYPDASIRPFERKDKISFISQNALFYILDQQTRTLEAGNYTSIEALEALGSEVNTNVDVKKIDSEKKQIDYVTLKNQQLGQVTYDKLIFAAGSFPRLPVILGETPENQFILKSFGDALKLNQKVKKGHRAFILESGAIGVELARILVKRGMKVTRDKRIMGRTLDVQAYWVWKKR